MSLLIVMGYYEEKQKQQKIHEFLITLEGLPTSLTMKMLQEYEEGMIAELSDIRNRKNLKKVYCDLGYLNLHQADYETSNDYFFKALSIEPFNYTKLEVAVLVGISKNYLYLDNHVNSEQYFKELKNIANHNQDDELMATIYRRRAKDFLALDIKVDEAFYLSNESLQLSQVLSSKIESYMLLNEAYMRLSHSKLSDSYSLEEFQRVTDEGTNAILQLIKNERLSHFEPKYDDWFIGIGLIIGCLVLIYWFINKGNLKSVKKIDEKNSMRTTLKTLYETLEQQFEHYQDASVLVANVDDFNKYNETYGYVAGDEVLQRLEALMKSEFQNDLVVRLGGQQFIILTKDTESVAFKRANQLMNQVYELNIEHVTNLEHHRLTLTVGVVGGSFDSMLKLDQGIQRAQEKVMLSKKKKNYINE